MTHCEYKRNPLGKSCTWMEVAWRFASAKSAIAEASGNTMGLKHNARGTHTRRSHFMPTSIHGPGVKGLVQFLTFCERMLPTYFVLPLLPVHHLGGIPRRAGQRHSVSHHIDRHVRQQMAEPPLALELPDETAGVE